MAENPSIAIDLVQANLSHANLTHVNLEDAELIDACLVGTRLMETEAMPTSPARMPASSNFENAVMTGACLDRWQTN